MKSVNELLQHAKHLNKEEKFDEVVDLLKEELLKEYNSADLYGELLLAIWYLGRFNECEKLILITLQIDSEQSHAKSIDDIFSKSAISYALDYIKDLSLRHYSSVIFLGKRYFQSGQFGLAVKAFNTALRIAPEYSDSYIGLGSVYIEQNMPKKAKKMFIKALKLKKDVEAYIGLGNSYGLLNQSDKAEEAFLMAKKMDIRATQVYKSLANLYLGLGQNEKAVKSLREILRIKPQSAIINYELGLSLSKMRDYDGSIKAYSDAIVEINKEEVKKYDILAACHNGLGNCYKALEKIDEAISEYNKAIEHGSGLAGYYYSRALAYYHKAFKYEKDLALDCLGKSVKDFDKCFLNGTDGNYYDSVSRAKIKEINRLTSTFGLLDISRLIYNIKAILELHNECLTHFTSLSVAESLVLNNSPFRISEGTFLNDTSEGTELFNYLEFPSNTSEAPNARVMERPFTSKKFVGSFVVEDYHNDLTLWRMYGKEDQKEAEGCALTFDSTKILDYFNDKIIQGFRDKSVEAKINDTPVSMDTNAMFYKVAYIDAKKDNLFSIPGVALREELKFHELMKQLKNQVHNYISGYVDNPDKIKRLEEILIDIIYLFKTADYKYECEVRLVLNGQLFEKRIDKSLKPPRVFIESMRINDMITKITLGPKVKQADEWAAAFHYHLDKEGYNPEIHISRLPFK